MFKTVGRVGFFLIGLAVQLFFLLWFCYAAYAIRLYSVEEYGPIIHEFDPWFNYRAAQYMADNGLERFFKWYDYMSWYPLGRPIGTTIYPGMQITSVAIHEVQKWFVAQTIAVPSPFRLLNGAFGMLQ